MANNSKSKYKKKYYKRYNKHQQNKNKGNKVVQSEEKKTFVSLFLKDIPLLLDVILKNALRQTELLELIDDTHAHDLNGRNIEIVFRMQTQLSHDFSRWSFRLVELNMSELYSDSREGWMPNRKRSSLNKKWGRYIIVMDSESQDPLAFLQFRFVVDNYRNTLRIYDLQIENDLQGKGIGKLLIKILEKLCKVLNIEIILCKVLTNNHRAMKFFKKLDFELDYGNEKADKDKDVLSKKIFIDPPVKKNE